jgi:F0F1-type ATP synthase assembly protein I
VLFGARLPPEWVKSLGYFGVIIGELLGGSAVGLGLGWLLWQKAGLPSITLLFTGMAGLGAAFYRIYKLTQRDTGA